MNTTHAWTTLDLELYADDALPEETRERLSDSLRQDPALRERLAGVSRLDALARRALAAPLTPSAALPPPALRWSRFAALAACLALAAIALRIVFRPAPVPVDPTTITTAASPHRAPSGVRVVLSLPVTASTPRPPSDAATADAPAAELASALAEGDVDRAAAVIAAAEGEARDAQYRALGELIRSASAAEAVLDRLSPAEQLEACRRWAEQPRLRPAAFARLDRLSRNPDLTREFAVVIGTLADKPELRAWVRSYVRATPAEPVTKKI